MTTNKLDKQTKQIEQIFLIDVYHTYLAVPKDIGRKQVESEKKRDVRARKGFDRNRDLGKRKVQDNFSP
ncbi:hypothetical protein COV20_00780 [Candidatus Woesearchaeota archaeon CG10_big_fil_rev_8_21_14_0_10_45_16]|nr:MAG: hypothetical protein COV20_00780 [Candidatus Woesearchaeota archaeon CG10_big_fil_rev_8_21_14_0_10_45_16]